jgi:RNA recognition motif-containing protein
LKTGPPPHCESRGFCFARFLNFPLAEACKKILSSSFVEDRNLNVSWADSPVSNFVDEEIMSKVKTLYVSNLSVSVKDDLLRSMFQNFGEIAKCVICKNNNGESKGFAFVEFKERDSCIAAMNALHNTDFTGQRISVVLATPVPSNYKSKSKNWSNKNQNDIMSEHENMKMNTRNFQQHRRGGKGHKNPSMGYQPQNNFNPMWGGGGGGGNGNGYQPNFNNNPGYMNPYMNNNQYPGMNYPMQNYPMFNPYNNYLQTYQYYNQFQNGYGNKQYKNNNNNKHSSPSENNS